MMSVGLYLSSAGGKHLSSDTQIRVTGSVEPEICRKMLKNLTEKLRAKLPATTHGHSMVKFACIDDAFSEFFLTGSKPSRRSITAAER